MIDPAGWSRDGTAGAELVEMKLLDGFDVDGDRWHAEDLDEDWDDEDDEDWEEDEDDEDDDWDDDDEDEEWEEFDEAEEDLDLRQDGRRLGWD